MCLYMSSNVLTFRNIITATDGEPVASVAEVRRSARASHSLFYHRIIHVSSVPACKLSTAAAEKKERAKRAGRFTVPHWGLTGRRDIGIGLRKLCYFFREVDHNKCITCWATKVSFHIIFTLIIVYIVITTPY